MKALLKNEDGQTIVTAEIEPTAEGQYPEAIIYQEIVFIMVIRRDKNPADFLLYKRVSTAHIKVS